MSDIRMTLLAFAAGLLAAVFTLSGATKVRRPSAAAIAMRQFGVVARIRPANGRLLGSAELVLAASLLVFPARVIPFFAAAAALAVFLFLILRSLLTHNTFSCACFGGRGAILSSFTALRTGVLLAIAVIAGLVAGTTDSILSLAARLDGYVAGALVLCSVALASQLMQTHPFSIRMGSDV